MVDIVLISTWDRPNLFIQSIKSLNNAGDKNISSITTVLDCPALEPDFTNDYRSSRVKTIVMRDRVGASRCRNIGASSIPKYLRSEYVLFLDDDIYACPGWDDAMLKISGMLYPAIISGYEHPYNKSDKCPSLGYSVASVISSVCMLMKWDLWDDVGFFTEPGGPGGSEDVDYCNRAKKKGYGLAITYPQSVIHTGIISSTGKFIVGHDELDRQNLALIDYYKLDRIRFSE